MKDSLLKAVAAVLVLGGVGFFGFTIGLPSAKPEAPMETPMYIVQVPTNWPGKWLVFGGNLGIWNTQAEAAEGAAWMRTNQIKKP